MPKLWAVENELPSGQYPNESDPAALNVFIETNSYDVEDSYDPEDSWDRPDTETTYYGVGVTMPKDKYGTPVKGNVSVGDTVYVVLAQYSTGDTFGRDTGVVDLVGVELTMESAEGLVKAAEEAKDFGFEYDGHSYHAGWLGYFESLERIFIEETVVKKS